MKVINFYRTVDKYGCFSNFSKHPIQINGVIYPTSEHFFQSEKFDKNPIHKDRIIKARTAKDAAIFGRMREPGYREDWDKVKDEIMVKAVLTKFEQHEDIRNILLETEDAILVEHTTNDSYWGDGGTGLGKNMLGKILMIVREELRNKKNKNV